MLARRRKKKRKLRHCEANSANCRCLSLVAKSIWTRWKIPALTRTRKSCRCVLLVLSLGGGASVFYFILCVCVCVCSFFKKNLLISTIPCNPQSQLRDLKSTQAAQLKDLDAQLEQLNRELLRTTQEHTQKMATMADLTTQKQQIETKLNNVQKTVRVDSAVAVSDPRNDKNHTHIHTHAHTHTHIQTCDKITLTNSNLLPPFYFVCFIQLLSAPRTWPNSRSSSNRCRRKTKRLRSCVRKSSGCLTKAATLHPPAQWETELPPTARQCLVPCLLHSRRRQQARAQACSCPRSRTVGQTAGPPTRSCMCVCVCICV